MNNKLVLTKHEKELLKKLQLSPIQFSKKTHTFDPVIKTHINSIRKKFRDAGISEQTVTIVRKNASIGTAAEKALDDETNYLTINPVEIYLNMTELYLILIDLILTFRDDELKLRLYKPILNKIYNELTPEVKERVKEWLSRNNYSINFYDNYREIISPEFKNDDLQFILIKKIKDSEHILLEYTNENDEHYKEKVRVNSWYTDNNNCFLFY